MPGWGTGSFDNEDAQNFLKKLSSVSIEQLQEVLSRAADHEGYLEAAESSVVVVAGEIVASAKAMPPNPVPREISDWIANIEGTPSDRMSELARRAVERVRTQSELRDLWQEAEGLNEWSAGLRELESRLG